MTYYLTILAVCLLVALFYKKKVFAIAIASIILILFAGTRLDIDNDYGMYKYFFTTNFQSLKEFSNMKISIEYCIFIVNQISNFLFSHDTEVIRTGFLIFAFLGVITKMIAIGKYSTNIILSVVLYTTYLFLMQEMTTIRAGVASGIFLLSLIFLIEKKYIKYLLCVAFCFIFHTSSILFILAAGLIFLNLKIKYYYISLAISFGVIIFNQNIISILFLDQIFPKVATYLEILQWSKEDKLNIFNYKVLISLLFFLIFAYNYKKFNENPWFELLFRLHIISLIIFFMFSNTAAVFSTRSFELLSVVQILLFPMLLQVIQNKLKILVWFLIIGVSIIQLYYLVDIAKIYKTYESWLF